MAGFGWKIVADTLAATRALAGIQQRLGDKGRLLRSAGLLLLRSIDRNFQAGGRPKKWAPRSPGYGLRMRKVGKEKTLIVSGNLMNSITSQVEGDKLVVGSNLVYARIHQKGGMAGKGLKSKIPARPFLTVQDPEDVRRLSKLWSDWVLGKQ